MKRLLAALSATAAMALAMAAPAAAYELGELGFEFENEDGSAATLAGSHPYAVTTTLGVSRHNVPLGGRCNVKIPDATECEVPDAQLRDVIASLPPGFIGNQTALPKCTGVEFATIDKSLSQPACPDSSAIGIAGVQAEFDPINVGEAQPTSYVPIYNLAPPPGAAAKIGFLVENVPVAIEVGVTENPPHVLQARALNISQVLLIYGSELAVWGNPADAVHDPYRGHCLDAIRSKRELISLGNCPSGIAPEDQVALLSMPRSCPAQIFTHFDSRAWLNGGSDEGTATTPGALDCAALGFDPAFAATTTSPQSEAPTGLDTSIEVDDPGLLDPEGRAEADISRVEVELPAGMDVNPSAANGLGACSRAQLQSATPTAPGCPEASKLGEVEVTTPLLEEELGGSLYLATPDDPATPQPGAENPFDSLVALYLVIRHPGLGIVVKQPGEVRIAPDGQLTTVFSDVPELPFSQVGVELEDGPRAPLLMPRECGPHTLAARFAPSSGGPGVSHEIPIEVSSGPAGGPCPGPRPFSPGFEFGTAANEAGSYSPVLMRITRPDGDQDLTRLDLTLPPGLTGKLAGLTQCPDASLAAAKARPGRAELAAPSCPASSRVGGLLAAAGVGEVLTTATGSLYLGGPIGTAPLSVAAVIPAVAGPFDLGTVVVREALRLDPASAQVSFDGSSEPIPRQLQGIPLRVREVRIAADRPQFTLNPTSCDPFAAQARLWGSGANPLSAADDAPLTLSRHFQAAGCEALGFKPRLSFRLEGATERGGHPALRAVLRPRPGDANLASAVVRLPRSAFLDQGSIGTVCTRVQFAADNCPKRAIYGKVSAWTPLLENPLTGPAYLRSSDNLLPDLVYDLKGLVDIEAAGRIDSVKGGIRASFESLPDAPITKVVIEMQGGKKGLIENSADLCKAKHRANVLMRGHNGKWSRSRPVMKVSCKKQKRNRHGRGKRGQDR